MATIVGGIVGGAIGSVVPGGWWKGAQLGMALGSLFEPRPSYESPKLSDLRLTGSQEGTAIPRLWGRFRLGGHLIDAVQDASGNHLVQHRQRKSGGGGLSGAMSGPSVTEYWYSTTPWMAFCKGSMMLADGTIYTGWTPVLEKVWANDTIVYDSGAASSKISPVWYAGTESQAPNSAFVAAAGVGSSHVDAKRGTAGFVVQDWNLADIGETGIPNTSALISTGSFTLDEVLAAKFAEVGIAGFDVSAVSGITVRGFLDGDRSSPQAAVDMLLAAYNCLMVEVDGELVVIQRGAAAVATIPVLDLGDASTPELTVSTKITEELPGRVDVLFYDVDADYQQATASAVRQTADFRNARTVSLSLAMTADEARKVAQWVLDNMWLEREEVTFMTLPKWLWLAPGDVVNVETSVGTERVRITRMQFSPFGAVEFSGVRDLQIATLAVPPGTSGTSATTPPAVVPSAFDAWSGTEIIDAHKGIPGFYVVASGDVGWSGCVVYYSLDDGVTWLVGPSVVDRGVFGVTTGVLSGSGAVANAWDTSNTVGVDLSDSFGVLEAVSRSQVEGGDNYLLVGAEILGVSTPTLVSTNVYTLSDLRRGGRSTAMTGHASGERVALLNSDAARIEVPLSMIGDDVKVKCVSAGQTLGDVTALTVTIATPSQTDAEVVSDRVDALTDPKPANQIFAGPTSGVDADPAFRHLVAADLPPQMAGESVSLTDGATITIDATVGNDFRVTLGGNRTLAITGGVDTQRIILEVKQDGTGGRTLTHPTGSPGSFSFSDDLPTVTLSSGSGKVDLVEYRYNGSISRWQPIRLVRGF